MVTDSTPSGNTIKEALAWGEKQLLDAGIQNARMESIWILDALKPGSTPTELILESAEALPEAVLNDFVLKVKKRATRLPLAYVIGTQEFCGMVFAVDGTVLVPRPETELLVEEAVKRVRGGNMIQILDIGTGSGVVAVSLAAKRTNVKVVATDLSDGALSIARRNAEAHEVIRRISFLKSDIYSSLAAKKQPLIYFDMIVSNPPYVRTEDIPGLEKELQFEPREALDGGPDGLRVIEPIVKNAPQFLRKGGTLLLEVGQGQSKAVQSLMRSCGFSGVSAVKDPAGIERVVLGTLEVIYG